MIVTLMLPSAQIPSLPFSALCLLPYSKKQLYGLKLNNICKDPCSFMYFLIHQEEYFTLHCIIFKNYYYYLCKEEFSPTDVFGCLCNY